MPPIPAPWKTVAAYGLLAAVLLACLYVIALAPLSLDWGRELIGAAIAIVALGVGLHLAQQRRGSSPPPAQSVGTEPLSQRERGWGEGRSRLDPTPQDMHPDPPPLSARERQVLDLLADGLSNKQMARALSLSENTVKTHLGNVYAKLGVGRRTEALAAARRHQLLRG